MTSQSLSKHQSNVNFYISFMTIDQVVRVDCKANMKLWICWDLNIYFQIICYIIFDQIEM